jgi:S-adenosylmethionine-diacylglycerol 3-amino-3-carboxypropyl transferase
VDLGIGAVGKFEQYFRIFRTRVLPLIHSRARVARLLKAKLKEQRIAFYENEWNNWLWQALFRLFFRGVSWARSAVLRHSFNMLKAMWPLVFSIMSGSPSQNWIRLRIHIYIWILNGTHNGVLPFTLREENIELIRRNLDKLEWRCSSIEDALNQGGDFECFNLSDIFEYMSPENYEHLLRNIVASSRSGARLAYWNMLVSRSRPNSMDEVLEPLRGVSRSLFAQDKAFFYSAFIVERVR